MASFVNLFHSKNVRSIEIEAIYKLLETGEIAGEQVDGRWRIRKSVLDTWLDARASPEEPQKRTTNQVVAGSPVIHTQNIPLDDQPEQPPHLRSGGDIIETFAGTNPRNADRLRVMLGMSDDELRRFRRVAPDLSSAAALHVEDTVATTRIDAAKIARARDLALELLTDPDIYATEIDRVHLNTALRHLALPEDVQEQLRDAGLLTLAQVRQKGRRLAQIKGLLPEQVTCLSALADLAIISPDVDFNTRLFDAGVTSPLQLTNTNLERLAAGLAIEPEMLQPLVERADTYRGMMLSSLTAASIALAPNYASLDLYRPERESLALFRNIVARPALVDACTTCHPCESALSPGAYLVDLLDFLRDSFPNAFQTLEDFERRFFRPFKSLNLGCEGIERKVRQIDIANEVLVAFVQSHLPGLTRAALYAEFRTVSGYPRPRVLEYMFDAYVAEMGTSRAEVEAANTPALRTALAERLGIAEADLASLNRPDPALITLADVEALPDLVRRGKEKGIDPTDPRQLPALNDARAQAAAAIGRVQDALLPDVRANLIHAALQLRGDLPIVGDPVPLWGNDTLHVYVCGPAGQLWEISKDATRPWQSCNLSDQTGVTVSGMPTAVLDNDATIHVYIREQEILVEFSKQADAVRWQAFRLTEQVGAYVGGEPMAVWDEGGGIMHVYASGWDMSEGQLLEFLKGTTTVWQQVNLSELTHVYIEGKPMAIWAQDAEHIYVFSRDGRLMGTLWELHKESDPSPWQAFNLSDQTGVPIDGEPTAVWVNGTMYVYARGREGRLWEFYNPEHRDGTTPWQAFNLSAQSGVTISGKPTPLWVNGTMYVYARGREGQLWQFYYAGRRSSWQAFNVSEQTGVPIDGEPMAVRVNGTMYVYARGREGQLWEFSKGGTTWQAVNRSAGSGSPLFKDAKELSNLLHIDLLMDACAVTTRIQDVIEAIQSLVQAYQLGRISLPLATPRADFDDRWRWMQSYGLWHAAQTVYLYPENFLLPSIRRTQTPQFRAFLEAARGKPTPDSIREEVRKYADEIIVGNIYKSFAAVVNDRVFLFSPSNTALGQDDRVYWTEHMADGSWTGWASLNLSGRRMLGAVGFNERIYLFFRPEQTGSKELEFTWLSLDGNQVTPAQSISRSPLLADEIPTSTSNIAFVSGTDHLTVYFVKGAALSAAVLDRGHHWGTTLANFPMQLGAFYQILKSIGHLAGRDYLLLATTDDLFVIPVDKPYEHMEFEPVTRGAVVNQANWQRITVGTSAGSGNYSGTIQDGQFVVGVDRTISRFAFTSSPNWLPFPMGSEILLTAGERLVAYTGERYLYFTYDGQNIRPLLGGLTRSGNGLFIPHPRQASEHDSFRIRQFQLYVGSQPSDFVRLILDEWYCYIPLAAARVLCEAKQYAEAMAWLNTLYHPFIANRQVYYGLSQPTGSQPNLRESAIWQRDPFDPYRVARTRSGTFLRHTIYQHVENLLDWADAEFARDTSEAINRARELYELAEDILLGGEMPQDNCAAAWSELHREVYARFSVTDAKLLRFILDPLRALDGRLTRSDIVQLHGLIISDDGADERLRAVKQYADLIAARPLPDRSLETILREQETCGTQMLNRAGVVFGRSLPSVNIYSHLFTNGESRRGETAVVFSTALKIGCGFCTPPNPMLDILRFRIESNLEKIHSCRNAAGMRRTMRASTMVHPLAAVQETAVNEELDEIIPTEPPPIFRFSYLIERARYYVQVAQQLESQLLNAIEKEDAETYSLMKARQDMRIAKATLDLQGLRVTEANDQVTLATLQRDRAQFQANHFQELLTGDLLGWENTALILQVASAAQLTYAAAVKTGVAIAAGIATFGAAALPQSAEAAVAGASATSALATWQLQIASFERRKQEWTLQRNLAQRDTAIGDQGITLANDHVNIINKERDIADLHNQFANEVVTFLGAKFTNRQLWEWMSRTLRRYLREHLNMATVTGRMAQTALAFERQEPITIVAPYYVDHERRDLLTAEQLLTDINRLDQHRLTTQKRAKELTKTISLAAVAPVEFEKLRQNGWFEFTTLLDWFDRDFPGHYLRLIKNVSLTIVAIVPPGEAIHTTLSNNGVSRAMVGIPYTQYKEIQRQPESVAITTANNGTGLFEARLDDPILLPFEGSGVETTWRLEMPKECTRNELESKWRETMVSGCKGPSVYGRNLGTCMRCSNVLPCQEDPHGRARCGNQYSGRRASAPGTAAVCQGICREPRGARSREGHLQAAAAHWIGGDEALLRPAWDG